MKIRRLSLALIAALSCVMAAAQVSPSAPPPNRQLQPPTSSTQPQSPGVHPESVAGTIEGFVYWDASAVQHNPANSCSGLGITVSVGQSSGSPFTVYTPIGTLTNNFKYVGQVKAFMAGGKTIVYDVCTYGFNKLPVGPPLQVKLTVMQGTFSPVATPQYMILGPITIINGQCNMLPHIVNPTLSDLGGHWGTCQNMAFNVNFSMLPGAQQNPPAPQQPLLTYSGQTAMLSGAQPGTLSAPVSPSSTQLISNPGTPRTAVVPTDQPGANSQPSSSGQPMTNIDVIRMVQSGIPDPVVITSIQSANKQFDFSPAGTEALQRAHVSPPVLAAMCDGSVRSCPQGSPESSTVGGSTAGTPGQANAGAQVSLNPQPIPPGQRPANTGAPLLSNAPKSTGMLSNPAPASADIAGSGAGGSSTTSSEPSVGFTGGVRPSESNSPAVLNEMPAASLGNAVGAGGAAYPKMPPMKSNAKRDASSPADARERAKIQTKVKAQLAGSRSRIGTKLPQSVATVNAEIQALQSQTAFVQSFRGINAQAMPEVALTPDQVAADIHAAPNRFAIAPEPLQVCFAPTVRAVNGKTTGVTFTQDPQFNDYIIFGCGFGSKPGKIYLSGAVTGGRINLVVKKWTDTQIEAMVEPGLTGVLDGWPDLIVAPVKGTQAKLPNCRFYAQRQSVILKTIPQQYATLANVTVGDSTHGSGTMYCPSQDHLFPCVSFNAGPPLDGITNGHDYRNYPNQMVSNAVDRDGGQMPFDSGVDEYDFGYMAPGFEVDDFRVFWFIWTSEVCESWGSDAFPKKPGDSVDWDTEGYYNTYQKTKTKLVVGWAVDHCAWRWLKLFQVDDWYNSGYSLQVSVKGPIGIDPWTGHSLPPNYGQLPPNSTVMRP